MNLKMYLSTSAPRQFFQILTFPMNSSVCFFASISIEVENGYLLHDCFVDLSKKSMNFDANLDFVWLSTVKKVTMGIET